MPDHGSIAAIILAAGRGARFAPVATVTPKPMARTAGEPMLSRTLRIVRDAGAWPIVAVLGHRHVEVARAVPPDIIHTVAHDWRDGVSASIRAGVDRLEADCFEDDDLEHRSSIAATLVLPADQPGIEAAHLAMLIAAYRHERPDAVAVTDTADATRQRQQPTDRVRGAPALFDRRVFPQLRSLTGDAGARRLLTGGNLAIHTVGLPTRALTDVDTVADLARFEASRSGTR